MENYVFVTGADGMLGSVVCRELLSRGYAAKALVLNKKKAFNLNDLDLECCEGNVLDGDFIHHATHGARYLIHTAALTAFWPRKAKQVLDVNLNGTFNVMNAVLKNGMSRMVHIGTACSFSAHQPNHPGNEENEPAVDRYKSDYIRSKLMAQHLLLDAHRRKDLPVVILNPTFMIGPFDSGPSSGVMIQSYWKKKIPGCSSGGKNFVYSRDVAAAAVNALTIGKPGSCYITGNENLSYMQFFEKVAKVIHQKNDLRRFSDPLILSAGFGSSVWARLSGTKPLLSYTMARISLEKQFYDSTRAIQELNLPQTPLEVAIKDSVTWFSENGYLQ